MFSAFHQSFLLRGGYFHPRGLHTIRAGTILCVHKMGGGEDKSSFSWSVIEDCGIDVLSVFLTKALCRHYKLPTPCFQLVWNRPGESQGECTVTCTYILKPLEDDADSAPEADCFICWSPCADADDTDSRSDNCCRCNPCWLCKDCSVKIKGKACCYSCLMVHEIELVSDQLRLQMLRPELFEEADQLRLQTEHARNSKAA